VRGEDLAEVRLPFLGNLFFFVFIMLLLTYIYNFLSMMIVKNSSDYVSIKCSGHSIAARDRAKCLSNSIISLATLVFKIANFGNFVGPWGRLEKCLPFYFRIITSYLKMCGMP
jgi:hypothetical protein